MLLYHLQNPHVIHTRPCCSFCKEKIRDVRWHCGVCEDFELCDSCYTLTLSGTVEGMEGEREEEDKGDKGKKHPHELTPFRVTYV